jgi:predicted nucleotidyltransferase
MMSVDTDLTPEKLAAYRATMHARAEAARLAGEKRRADAWQVARQAAVLLKDAFAAEKVVLFGSLVHEQWFFATSDIDLAVWGIAIEDYFTAVAHLQDLSPRFKIDLIDMAFCPPKLLSAIQQEGISL